jgi:lipopolysaccharide export system permease protein
MKRLTAYLFKLFAINSLALFGVTALLLWLIQSLRVFDVVSVKGQGMFTLLLQSGLGMPPLAIVFVYVCAGIGLGRGLRSLQASHELHIIHASRQLPLLLRATGLFALAAVLFVLLLSNFGEPYAARERSRLAASIAADLVGRTLVPNRFTQVSPGVVVVIGGRSFNGEISDFFADDRRDPERRRTYVADSAVLGSDARGYILQLRDGSLQYTTDQGRFSEIAFGSYFLAMDQLVSDSPSGDAITESDTPALVARLLGPGGWDPFVLQNIIARQGEGLRVLAMCMLVLALAGWPSGRRSRFTIPLEVLVMVVAFMERAVTAYATGPFAPLAGATAILVISLSMIAVRLRPRRIPEPEAVPA